MSCTYLIDSRTSTNWKHFFDNLTGSKHPTMIVNTTDKFNLMVINALRELGAAPLFDETLMGETYIKGAVFESGEDLLHFKIKFG